LPPEAAKYTSGKMRRLVGLCAELYRRSVANDEENFILTCRDAAVVLGMGEASFQKANSMLLRLEGDRVLDVPIRGSTATRVANRYRYLPLVNNQGGAL
jgi:hypothetical protein